MPGVTALCTAGAPSARPRASVVRNPPIAGPKPTQAMSTSMVWRSGAGAVGISSWGTASLLEMRGKNRRRDPDRPDHAGRARSLLYRVVERFGDHHLRDGVGGAVLREARSGEAAVELRAEG